MRFQKWPDSSRWMGPKYCMKKEWQLVVTMGKKQTTWINSNMQCPKSMPVMEIKEKVMKLTFKFHSLCCLNDQG